MNHDDLYAKHTQIGVWCAGCEEELWPCRVVALIDENRRYREALENLHCGDPECRRSECNIAREALQS